MHHYSCYVLATVGAVGACRDPAACNGSTLVLLCALEMMLAVSLMGRENFSLATLDLSENKLGGVKARKTGVHSALA